MIENKSNKNNSMTFNPIEDDLTYRGYAALACCIWGDIVNGIEIKPEDTIGKEERIKRAYGLFENNLLDGNKKIKNKKSKPHKSFKYINLRLIDVNNGKVVKRFNNIPEASKFLGLASKGISSYILKGYIRNKKYKIEADLNPDYVKGTHARMSVRAINVKTGFSKECEAVKEATEISGLSGPTIYLYAKDKIISRNGWKFEYIED